MTFFGDEPMPSFGVAIDVAGVEAEAEALLAALERALIDSGPEIQRDRIEIGGVEATVLHPRSESGAVAHAFAGGCLIVTNSTGYLRDCLQSLHGQGQSMCEQQGYRAAQDKAAGDVLASLFVDMAPVTTAIKPFLP